MRIVHCADIHLGRRRLDGRLPDDDFARALEHIVARAVAWKADIFLIAGDLFDTPQIPPPVLRQACRALAPLKAAGIPAIAIEGNHDRHGGGTERATWVKYLAEEGLLALLATPFRETGPELKPYDTQSGSGALLESGGVRFVGAGYLGAGTDRKARAIADALPADGRPTVVLLHAGPEYFVGEGGGFKKETLDALREKVTYLALGHIHKPMTHGGEGDRPWAVNPGAPECCRLEEADQAKPRGWAEVEIETGALPGMALSRAVIRDFEARRPVLRVALDVAPFGNKLKAGAEAIEKAALKAIAEASPTPEAVVRLFLHGELNIGRIAVEPLALGQRLAEEAKVAGVEVNLDGVKLFTGRPGSARAAEGLTTAQIERLALEELLRERPVDDLEEHAAELAEFCVKLRGLVERGADAQAVLELLEQSPLPARMNDRQKSLV